MKPDLREFFLRMERYFRDPRRLDALYDEFGGPASWDAPRGRVSIYGRFVDGHVRDALEKNYPLVRAAVGEERWARLVLDYTRQVPATHFELNQAASSFPAFLGDRAADEELPAFVPALARFEWADFEVFSSPEEIPDDVPSLTPNPTLTVLQHPYALVTWIRTAPAARPATPAPADETVLMWRHPSSHLTMYLAADPRALLVLKLAVEGISFERASAEAGMSAGELRTLAAGFARDGMVLLPRSMAASQR